MYQETKIPIILKILTSKNKPNLNLSGPRLIQLFGLCPKPNEWDKIKKSLTTPSGIINPINIDKAVPIIHPIKIIDNSKNMDFLYIIFY